MIQASDGSKFPEVPSPGFGKKTIKDTCQAYNLLLPEVLGRLRRAGFTAQEDDTVKEISSSNESNTMVIFEIIKEIAK